MNLKSQYTVDIFAEVVNRVRFAMQSEFDSLQKPYFKFDSQTQLIRFLTEKDKSIVDKEKYPIIYLEMPFKEDYNVNDGISLYEVSVNLWIITATKLDLYANGRYDKTFREVLYPIFEQLIDTITRATDLFYKDYSGRVRDFSKTDLFGDNAKLANDSVDAILIENLKLKVKKCIL